VHKALDEARTRGPPIAAARLLMVAPASRARSGYLLRLATAEVGAGRSMLLLDFGSGETELLAFACRSGRVVVCDTAARERVFPVGGWHATASGPARGLAAWLAGWLRPHGVLADAADVQALVESLGAVPFAARESTLYAWRRLLDDTPFRGALTRELDKAGVNVRALRAARPGTGLFRLLRERVEHVLGHDDTLDRVFPRADPSVLVEPSPRPEVRCVRFPLPDGRASRHASLCLMHALLAVGSRERRRKDDPRAHVGRLVLVDPPGHLLPLLEVGLPGPEVFITAIVPAAPVTLAPERWLGPAPAVLVLRDLGPRAVAAAAAVEERQARVLLDRSGDGDLLFAHQRGLPPERWAVVRPVNGLLHPVPGALSAALREGERRFTVARSEVIQNRQRLEAHIELRGRRIATADLLPRLLEADRLTEAWRQARRNRGVAGTDEVTIEAFEARWQGHLQALAQEVRAGTYRPRPLLRVWRDKASGGKRPVGIPAVRDRVRMGAAAELLSGVLEPTFSDRSHAYRPERGARRAVSEIVGAPDLAESWAIVADVASYFDTIDHRLLLAMLREHVADEGMLRLVGLWLRAPVRDQGRDQANTRGVPQGCSVSPVLANLYLTPLDRWMERRGLPYARYADDFVALCPSEAAARQVAEDLETFLARELHLSVKSTKTSFVSVREGFDFLGFRVSAEGLALAPGRPEQCIEAMRTALAGAAELLHLRSLDALVRGFRNYFDLPHPFCLIRDFCRVGKHGRGARAPRQETPWP
jgi:RNA-directed DNA polymerase